MAKHREAVRVGFIALGCPKNIVDSERMLAEIAEAGYLITTDPGDADVVVINTCGFIAPARAEAFGAIEQTVERKRTGGVKKLIVAGCLPQRLGRELFQQADGIDTIVGLGQRDNIAHIVERTLSSDARTAYLDQECRAVTDEKGKRRHGYTEVHDDRARLRITPAHWAYLRISEGCSHGCSYCTIPAIRGPFRSKPPELVLAEAAELVSAGAVELNVIGQDTTYYGRDLETRGGLSGLLEELAGIPGLEWMRLMYTYPAEIDDRLIEVIGTSETVVHYVDMPIQHINSEILKKMHRPDTKERICSLIEKLRSVIEDIVLRTTLIVGFPGETDKQFGELLEFIKWAQFDALGCFKFHAESGTLAAALLGQVPEDVKEQRVEQLMLTQQRIAFAKSRTRIGGTLRCLVDSTDGEVHGQGRFYGQAPDIDSVCIIENCSAAPGRFVDTKVIGTKDYDLIVKQI